MEIISCFENNKTRAKLSEEYGVSRQAIDKILSNKENYEAYSQVIPNHTTKKISMNIIPTDQAVSTFVKKANQANLPISRLLLQSVALQENSKSNLKASRGWAEKFLKRQQIQKKRLCGESSSVDTTIIDKWIINNASIISKYKPKNIFNCDETAIFWK